MLAVSTLTVLCMCSCEAAEEKAAVNVQRNTARPAGSLSLYIYLYIGFLYRCILMRQLNKTGIV